MRRLQHSGLGLGVLTLLLGLSFSGPAAAAAKVTPKIGISAKPAAATEGDQITIPGRITGLRGKASYRVDLEVKKPKGKAKKRSQFVTRSTTKIDGKSRFSLKYRVPKAPGVVSLRLRLVQGKRIITETKAWKLSIRAAVPVGPDQKSQTVVLSPESVTEAPKPGEAGQMRLAGLVDLNPGDILAVGVGTATPYGFLGKVVSVSHDASSTTVQTAPATLPEAVPEGSFSGEIDPEPLDSETFSTSSSSVRAASATIRNSGGSTPGIQIYKVINCGPNNDMTVSGTVELDSRIEVSGSWGPVSGVKAKFVGHLEATGELEVAAEAGVSCSTGSRTLFLDPLSAVTFWVGSVPVVLVPLVSATLSGEGDITGSASTSATGSVAAEAGIDYYDGRAHPIGGIQPTLTGGSPPTATGSGHVGATLSPAFNVLVYGVGGPQAALNAGLSLDAVLSPDPHWTLTAPVSVTASLAIPALSINSPQLTIWKKNYPLAEGS